MSSRRILFALLIASSASAQDVARDDSAARAAVRASTLPLIPTRTLRFTTDEGTWMSVDISSDGRTLLFDLLGDLYTLPAGGGTARRITSGPAFDAQPRWSPDGKQIVFTSDRDGSENVWVADADGSHARALTKGDKERYVSPVFTPDGAYIIASKGQDLWLFHQAGGHGVKLTGAGTPSAPSTSGSAGASGRFLGAAFGKDPRYLWVSVAQRGRGGYQTGRGDDIDPTAWPDQHVPASSPRMIGAFQIAQYDRETGVTFVRSEEVDAAMRPVASPDGRWLVFAARHDGKTGLRLRDLTNGDERWLVAEATQSDHEASASRDAYPGSAFTPDSKALVTSYGGKLHRVEVPSGRATNIPFTAEVEQQIGPLAKFDYPIDDTVLTVAQIRNARPSPDGKRLLFTALDRLWTADLPAGRGGVPSAAARATIRNARRITDAHVGEHAAVWSPDGKWIAYVTWSDSIGGDVWRIPSTGGTAQKLSRLSAFYDQLAYSPDGTRLVGVRGSRQMRTNFLEDFGRLSAGAELELFWMPAAGGETKRITLVNSEASLQGRSLPHFGPDTTRIYIYDSSDGLLSMRWDGTDRRAIVKVSGVPVGNPFERTDGTPTYADEIRLSPDGTRALALVQHNVYLMDVPLVGGQTPTFSVVGATASVPVTRLTRVGGDFVGWDATGKSAFFSIGHSFFRWDVALADSLKRDSTARADSTTRAGGAARADTSASRGARYAYEPQRVDVAIAAPKDRPRGTVVLRGARIITMKGSEIIENGDVVVRDNRIVAVGARGQVSAPSDARVIDVAGKTILPGYVDIHAHLWVPFGVHRTQVSQYLAQLAFGVTTMRDPQTLTEDVLSYGDLVDTGELIGPRLYSTGPGIFSSDPITSLDDARDVLRRYSDFYDTKTIKQYMVGDRKVRQWVITAARELGLTTTTEGGADFKMNLTLMQDGYAGLEHSLPIYPLYKDVVQLESYSGITYTPTLIVSYGGPEGKYYWLTRSDIEKDPKLRRFTPHDELDKWKRTYFHRDDQYVFPALARELTKLVAAGGKVGLGSHGEVQGIGLHWELWMLGSGGLTPHDVLRIGTQTSADAIGLGKDIGSIEVGKLADLQVLDADPLADLKNTTAIRYVMKNGRLYEAATLNEVWPRARPLGPQWWTGQ